MEQRRQQGEDELGDDIATGLVHGDGPDGQQHRLVTPRQPGPDHLPQPDAVGGQVVGENEDRHQLREDRQRRAENAEQPPAVLLRQLSHPLGGELEVGIDLVDVERRVEGLVDPLHGLAHGAGESLLELLSLADEDLPEQRAHAEGEQHHAEQHDPRGCPPFDP